MIDVEGGHVSRALLIYHPENFAAAVRTYADVLKVAFEPEYEPCGFGLRIAISLRAGVEIITPIGDGSYSDHMRDALRARGEGLLGLVFSVPDLDMARQTAVAAGHPPVGSVLDCFDANPAWRGRFKTMIEIGLPPVAGVMVTLAQAVARDAINKEHMS